MRFLGLLFVSYIPNLALKKQSIQKCQMGRPKKKKKTQQRPISIQRTRKGKPGETKKLLDNNSSTPAKYYRIHCGFMTTHARKDQMGSLDFYTCETVMRYPTLQVGWCQKRPFREPRLSSLPFPWSGLRGGLEESQDF